MRINPVSAKVYNQYLQINFVRGNEWKNHASNNKQYEESSVDVSVLLSQQIVFLWKNIFILVAN